MRVRTAVVEDPLAASTTLSPGIAASGSAINPGETGTSGGVIGGSAFAPSASLRRFGGTRGAAAPLGAVEGFSSTAGSNARYPFRARTFTPVRVTATSIARYFPSNVAFDAV